jgi:hypothetical protein
MTCHQQAMVASIGMIAGIIAFPSLAKPLNPSVEQLRSANHRLCSEPKSDQGRMKGMCFLFRKEGDQIVGQYFKPYTEKSICVKGVVHGNLITGFAREVMFSQSPELAVREALQTDHLALWDPQGDYLKVAQGEVVKNLGDTQLGYSGLASFNVALLNLNEFYRYNAGKRLPHQSSAGLRFRRLL